jgi:uncharacterized protein (TIGR00297 family)
LQNVCALSCSFWSIALASTDGRWLLAALEVGPAEQVWIRLLPACLVTIIFALLALRLRSVTLGGALAGCVISLAIYMGSGAGGFVVLGTVFVLTATATRIGHQRKQRLGAAENPRGRRASQVLANLSVAAVLAVINVAAASPWVLLSMIAALAEAAADTVSSECGQAWSDRVYLVTTFRRVASGMNGGISLPGTLAGVASGVMVIFVGYSLQLIPLRGAVLAGVAAVVGMLSDSLLGATVECRGWLGNNGVNFISTLAAAGLARLLLL